MAASNREPPGPAGASGGTVDYRGGGGAGGGHDDNGGGAAGVGGGQSCGSWAEVLSSTLTPGWNKNILEVVLEKDQRGGFVVGDHGCARVMMKIGLDMRPGVNVETIQICQNGRGVILITLKPDIPIGSFCRHEVFEVTTSGIRAVNIKPAGKREVVVTIKGLHPNTRDDGVLNYLSKFAKPVTNRVVQGVFAEGPLVGFRNGDRSYKLELSPGTNIGTYHAIDGQKVTLRYLGQQQTCARCHETAKHCRGGAMAKKCEAVSGPKVEFTDYIMKLWKEIGYLPGVVEMAAVYDDHGEDSEQVAGNFTPSKKLSNPEKYGGVSIRQFPKETDSGEIMELLVKSGLPEVLKDNIVIRPNCLVSISKLDNKTCLDLIENIHSKKFFGRKLFCNGVIPLTPEKEGDLSSQDVPTSLASSASPSASSASQSTSTATASSSVSASTATMSSTSSEVSIAKETNPADVTLVSSEEFKQPIMSQTEFTALLNDDLQLKLSDTELVRRHSLSLRSTPPSGSLADDILTPHIERTKTILDDIKDLHEQLSDFASCNESVSSSGSGDEDSWETEEGEPQDFKSMNDSKRGFKKTGYVPKKRKASFTPPKEFYLKKQYLEAAKIKK